MTEPRTAGLLDRFDALVVEWGANANPLFVSAVRRTIEEHAVYVEDEARADAGLPRPADLRGLAKRGYSSSDFRRKDEAQAVGDAGLTREDWSVIDGCLSACANDPKEPERYRRWYGEVLDKVRALAAPAPAVSDGLLDDQLASIGLSSDGGSALGSQSSDGRGRSERATERRSPAAEAMFHAGTAAGERVGGAKAVADLRSWVERNTVLVDAEEPQERFVHTDDLLHKLVSLAAPAPAVSVESRRESERFCLHGERDTESCEECGLDFLTAPAPAIEGLDVERLTEIMHAMNEDGRGCDHSMSRYHDDDRPGYERECLSDARRIAAEYARLAKDG